MPTLGDSGRNTATAYDVLHRRAILLKLFLGFGALFILKNVLFHDYRAEQVDQLTKLGFSEEKIRQYIPEPSTDRRQSVLQKRAQLEELVIHVNSLQAQVTELQEIVLYRNRTRTLTKTGDVTTASDETARQKDEQAVRAPEKEAAESKR